jgi:hypothetical protein
MTYDLKPLSREAVSAAIAKAERYRLLNEPSEAESICLDVLLVDPDHQDALVMLLLSLTDQFGPGGDSLHDRARELLPRLNREYDRMYYAGIILERRAKAHLHNTGPGWPAAVFGWVREAMRCYEQAEPIRPPGNDDARLRWNACARLLMANAGLRPAPEERFEEMLE